MSVIGNFFSTIIIYTLFTITLIIDILWFPLVYIISSHQKLDKSYKKPGTSKHVTINTITWKSTGRAGKIHKEMIEEKIKTMAEMMMYYSHKHKSKKCLGTRRILNEFEEKQPNGKTFLKYSLGEYKWSTFAQVDQFAKCFGRGIRELGNMPHNNVAIFAETRAEWIISAHGLFKQSMPIVTLYATLGEPGVIHAINETEVTIIITSHELMHKIKNILEYVPLVDTVIYMEDQLKVLPQTYLGCKGGRRLIKYTDVIKLGDISTLGPEMPSPEDIAIIMYTSGSTGTPKGVVLRHKNLMATMRAFADITESMEFTEDESMLGFLPLAHIFELLVENVCLCTGIPIGYSNPNTLMNNSSKVMIGNLGDAVTLKPTIMSAVPLILDRMAKGVRENVDKSGFASRTLFYYGYKYKSFWVNRGYATPITDRMIFSKVSKLLGGNVRNLLCGGAPLAVETQRFIQNCLGLKIVIGYGLTETTSCATVMSAYDSSYGRVGQPTTSNYIRLINWRNGGYLITDKPNPRGEIMVGGPNVSSGYFHLPEKTNIEFSTELINNTSTEVHWFKTGDIGEVFEDGSLAIIDRRKDLVKLQNGEYISLAKIETALKTNPLIENACVVASPGEEFCVALISPNKEHLENIAWNHGINLVSFEDICNDPLVAASALKVILEHCKQCNFEKYEIPALFKICCMPWTPDTGMITPTFKLRRKVIEGFYSDEIDRMYRKLN